MIIGLSGRKQSGKDTMGEFLAEWCYKNDIQDTSTGVVGADIYSFATPLKDMCIELLGLKSSQCYGTDEDKNSLTEYEWENFPPHIRVGIVKHKLKDFRWYGSKEPMRTGPMTAREILQVVGTDIFRNMFSDQIWVNATIRKINDRSEAVSIITDLRFESEVNAVYDNDGYVIRLLRRVGEDGHESEAALDGFDFSKLGDHALVIDNRGMSIDEQNAKARDYVESHLSDSAIRRMQ